MACIPKTLNRKYPPSPLWHTCIPWRAGTALHPYPSWCASRKGPSERKPVISNVAPSLFPAVCLRVPPLPHSYTCLRATPLLARRQDASARRESPSANFRF